VWENGGMERQPKPMKVHSILWSYKAHLVYLIGGSTLSAIIVLLGMLWHYTPPVYAGTACFMVFVVWAAVRVVKEHDKEHSKRYSDLQDAILVQRREFVTVVDQQKEQISALQKALVKDGPFIEVEWIWSAQELFTFCYHNIGDHPAHQAALSFELDGHSVRCIPEDIAPGQRKPIFVREGVTSPNRSLVQYLSDFHNAHGTKSLEAWAAGGHNQLTLIAEIRFYDQEGSLFATDWEIRRNFLEQPSTIILPRGPKRLV
jgi:hypothetical protein